MHHFKRLTERVSQLNKDFVPAILSTLKTDPCSLPLACGRPVQADYKDSAFVSFYTLTKARQNICTIVIIVH